MKFAHWVIFELLILREINFDDSGIGFVVRFRTVVFPWNWLPLILWFFRYTKFVTRSLYESESYVKEIVRVWDVTGYSVKVLCKNFVKLINFQEHKNSVKSMQLLPLVILRQAWISSNFPESLDFPWRLLFLWRNFLLCRVMKNFVKLVNFREQKFVNWNWSTVFDI